jgi:hypothetical protein
MVFSTPRRVGSSSIIIDSGSENDQDPNQNGPFWNTFKKYLEKADKLKVSISVVDPYVFRPPGSGSVIILYGSRSFHQAKKI